MNICENCGKEYEEGFEEGYCSEDCYLEDWEECDQCGEMHDMGNLWFGFCCDMCYCDHEREENEISCHACSNDFDRREGWNDTPYCSESCYLEMIAETCTSQYDKSVIDGHEVFFTNDTTYPIIYYSEDTLSWHYIDVEDFVLVVMNGSWK